MKPNPASIAFVVTLAITTGFAIGQAPKGESIQDAVASKTAKFESVSASSSEVKKALDAKDLAAGIKLAGKVGSFTGTIVSEYVPRSHSAIYLDFSKPYRNSISAQILAANFAKFPALSSLKGKKVLISGKFLLYEGKNPEVDVVNISSLKLVK
jgi:hypothetical protein